MKNKIKLICMALCTIFILTGCTSQKPSDVVESYFKEIKEGTNSDVSKYLEESIGQQTNSEGTTQESSKKDDEFINIITSKIDVKILSEKIDGDNATVEVELKGVNIANIVLEILQENISNAFSGIEPSDEDITNSMIEKAKTSELETRKGKVNLIKIDKKWQIKSDDDIMALIFGNVE